MTAAIQTKLTNRQTWKALATHYETIRNVHLRTLFADDPKPGERLTLEAAGLFSTTPRTESSAKLSRFFANWPRARPCFANRSYVPRRQDKRHRRLRRLHVALRMPRSESIVVDGQDVVADVHAVLDKMADFGERVRSGAWKGHTGKRIRNVINIGIGGSDLGPVMAYEALKYYATRSINFRFVSNIDSTDIVEALRDLDPAETLSSSRRRPSLRWKQ